MKVFVLTEEEVWDSYEPSYEQVCGVFSSDQKAHEQIGRNSFGREIHYDESSDRYWFSNNGSDFYYNIILLEIDQ